MTFATIIDVIVFRAGDDDGDYRARVRDWLNLARSEIAQSHSWRSAIDVERTITTAAATTSGIYSLETDVESINGDFMYDETNNNVIQHESLQQTQANDPDKSRTGDAVWWADAGIASSGARKIFLWPIPDSTATVRFNANLRVADITEANENLTVDPFLGGILPWASCFDAGLDYYYEKDNNEDVSQVQAKWLMFQSAIVKRKKSEGSRGTLLMHNVRNQQTSRMRGRLDPAHYNNRGF